MNTPEAKKGFTKVERDWLNSLREDIKLAEAIAGRSIQVDNQPGKGQVISADDCQ